MCIFWVSRRGVHHRTTLAEFDYQLRSIFRRESARNGDTDQGDGYQIEITDSNDIRMRAQRCTSVATDYRLAMDANSGM